MDFDHDDLAPVVVEEPSTTLPKPKLKRLKKAMSPSPPQQLADPRVSDSQDTPISPSASFPTEIHVRSSDAMCHQDSSKEERPKINLDPLFTYRDVEETRDALFMSEREGGDVRNPDDEEAVDVRELKKDKTVKRRLSLEDEEEGPNKKRKKKGRSRKVDEQNGKPKESIREKRKLEKARKVELEHLHADSQRLLRETRDATFKPVRHIKKSISSVLEKIRLRKLELLKSWKPSIFESDCPGTSGSNSDPVNHQSDIKGTDDVAKAFDVDSSSAYQNAITDTKVDNRLSNADNVLLNTLEASPSSYRPTSVLKVDCYDNNYVGAIAGGFDVSSSEEESDKENIGPSTCKFVEMDSSISSPKNGLVKAFLDDEAEEEYDSDGDMLRSQESEEENETEHEELANLIATGNDETPMDQEKHNELHQKWLEQQDAAETENVIQRLKCHQGRGNSSFMHGDSDPYDRSDDDDNANDCNDNCDDEYTVVECHDEAAYKHHTSHTTLQGFKKAKQMISRMFTDANDVYMPSDDEENERNFVRHRILKHNEEPSIVSPVEDENSREFFGLIKKLNIAPTTKKRGKASASALFDSLVVSGNSNSSSKSSFLNRASNSLPSSHKQRSSCVKTFIFGRDDSNSRSNISTADINSDMDQNGSSTANHSAPDKISSSQMKSSVNKRKVQVDSETRSSLFNILRQSSVRVESKGYVGNHVITESQAAHQFSAFKLRRI